MSHASPATTSAPEPSGWVRLAAAICLGEALTLLVLAAVELANLSRTRLAVGVTTTGFFVVYAVGLALAARGIGAGRSWARSPLVLSQLIQLGLAWSFYGSGTRWVAAVLAISALVVLVIVLLPSTTAALYGAHSAEEDPNP